MKVALFAVVAVLAAPALAQEGPYKLLVASSDGGVALTDYPTRSRCERARGVIEAENKRRQERARANLPQGAVLVRGPREFEALCIPG